MDRTSEFPQVHAYVCPFPTPPNFKNTETGDWKDGWNTGQKQGSKKGRK